MHLYFIAFKIDQKNFLKVAQEYVVQLSADKVAPMCDMSSTPLSSYVTVGRRSITNILGSTVIILCSAGIQLKVEAS